MATILTASAIPRLIYKRLSRKSRTKKSKELRRRRLSEASINYYVNRIRSLPEEVYRQVVIWILCDYPSNYIANALVHAGWVDDLAPSTLRVCLSTYKSKCWREIVTYGKTNKIAQSY